MLYYGNFTKDTCVYEYHDTFVDRIALEQLLKTRLREEFYTTTTPYKRYFYVDTIAGERKLIGGDYVIMFPFGCAVLRKEVYENSCGGLKGWNR